MKDLVVQIDVPYLSIREYAKRSGQSLASVRKQCEAGKLPVRARKDGEKYFINMALLTKEALSREF